MSGRAELFRALGALCDAPHETHASVVEVLGLEARPTAAEHTEVFAFQLYPYASVYLGAEGMLGGEARDRVAGFWRALGFVPPPEPDHLTALLGLYASLIEAAEAEPDPARRALWTQSRRALLWEHLLSWLPSYLDKLDDIAPPAYGKWGALVRAAVSDEAATLGPLDGLPLQLRAAPAPTPIERGPEFLRWLLAPVRSGLLLTRFDLQRAAGELDLGLRIGERRFVLESLLGQDSETTLRWLAAEARMWASRHDSWSPVTGDIARFFKERAEAAEALLLASLPAAKEVVVGASESRP